MAHTEHRAYRHTVLVVDDEESIRFALADYLMQKGHRVDIARTRPEAERRLAERDYSAVITDLQLTRGDRQGGLELIRSIRAHTPRTATVLVTAHRTLGLDREAARLGCKVVLSKPFPLGVIARVLVDIPCSEPVAAPHRQRDPRVLRPGTRGDLAHDDTTIADPHR
jgi:DNA-binding NtrC family response regulator